MISSIFLQEDLKRNSKWRYLKYLCGIILLCLDTKILAHLFFRQGCFCHLGTSDAQIYCTPRVWDAAIWDTGKSWVGVQIHTRLIREDVIHRRVTKRILLYWIFMDKWNLDIKEMAVISGDRKTQAILQKSTDRVTRSKECHQHAFLSSSRWVSCYLLPPCLPCRCPMTIQPACLTVARPGPRRVFIAARPPGVRSCVYLMYQGSIKSHNHC